MKPDATLYDPRPEYLRELLARSALTQEQAAKLLGISPRTLRYYLSRATDHQDAPYSVQFGLECLAGFNDSRTAVTEIQRTLTAIVKQAGGEITVRMDTMQQLSSRTMIEQHQTPAGDWCFKVREA